MENEIKKILYFWKKYGEKSELLKITESPNAIFLHFNFLDISKYSKNKHKKAIELLRICTKNQNIESVPSCYGHYALKIQKAVPDVVFLGNLNAPQKNSVVAGVDEHNAQVEFSLDEMTHALVAGTTGSGKSIFLNGFIYSILRNKENNVKIFAVDKKMALNFWEDAENCEVVVNDERSALGLVRYFQKEMYNRYKIMQKKGIAKNQGQFPKLVLIIDELADLMLADCKKEIEKSLVSLCQLGRAAGIHCVFCSQSPRVTVVSGLIQANTPTKIIFKTASIRESVLCLGRGGAEKLLGNGDCLLKLPHLSEPLHIQAPYASEEEFKNCIK